MDSVALYRKYRPKSFKEVLGQDHIISVLEGAIKQSSVSHAYLFSGSRGTGKTSVARIFARELGTSDKDLYEIDAASYTGVDDIRAIRDGVSTLPFDSKYKVYIIDEVHMLSKSAFNALLKTLEEPPKHAIFILATTELEKLPETVVSRCQTFAFQKPSQTLLRHVALSISKKEGYVLASSAADLVALLGDGSYRDTHGILQKIIASSKGKNIDVADVERVTGVPKGSAVNALLSAIQEGNLSTALESVASASAGNIDMKVFLKLLLHKARAVMLLRLAPELVSQLNEQFSEEDFALLSKLSKEKEQRLNSNVLRELLEAYEHSGSSYIPQLPLELALVRSLGGNS